MASSCAHSPVDKIFEPLARTDRPGCAVAVASNGRTVERRGFGMASLEYSVPITADTIFEAGSVSKQFTAGALLMLEQQGKLSLDDAARKYIPELPEVAGPITIRQMLNHTSGLRDWGVVAEIGGWPRGSRLHTMRQVIDIVGRQGALNYPPGSQYSYNNSGYNLAAIVAERVSGKSLPQLTRELFFEPLGMSRSSWRDDYTRVVPNRATAYDKRDGAYFVDMYPENIYGNCCLMTTIDDLLKWNAHLDRGGAFTEAMERQGVLTSGKPIDYALGLVARRWRGTREVAHTGSTGGYRAFLARYPEKRMSVALLCNDGTVSPGTLGREVAAGYLSLPPPVEQRREGGSPVVDGLYRDFVTDAVLNIAAGRIGFDRGPELRPLRENVYRAGDTELLMAGDTITHTFANRSTTYRRVAQARPSRAELAEYEGTYRSDEAEVTYRIARVGDALTVELPSKPAQPLLPTYADGFRLGDDTLIRFTRDGSGRIDGFDLKAGFDMAAGVARVERIHFTETR